MWSLTFDLSALIERLQYAILKYKAGFHRLNYGTATVKLLLCDGFRLVARNRLASPLMY